MKGITEFISKMFSSIKTILKSSEEKLSKSENSNVSIINGFQIDIPNIFVPWEIAEEELNALFTEKKLKKVTNGYYSIHCKSLKNLNCMIGFHFEPRKNGKLTELEFFRMDYNNQQKSFDEFQNCFQNAFGQPNRVKKGNEGFNNYEWRINNILIVHYVFDRFGPEEHMRIKKLK